MAKRARTGNDKPTSIRGEAKLRGIPEARVRKERALLRGLSNTQGRGHAAKGGFLLSLQVSAQNYWSLSPKKRTLFDAQIRDISKQTGRPLRLLWTDIVSPP